MKKNGETTRNEIVQAIKEYKQTHSFAPTIRELCDIVGLSSTSTMHKHIMILKQQGIVDSVNCGPRTISIVEENDDTKVCEVNESVG